MDCGRLEDTVIVRMKPSLDMSNSPEFKEWLKKECLKDGVKKVILDFSGVKSIDSYALGILVSIQKGLGEDGDLVIASPNDSIKKILDITSLNKILVVVDTLEEALEVKR